MAEKAAAEKLPEKEHEPEKEPHCASANGNAFAEATM